MNQERFNPVTKLGYGFFARHGAVADLRSRQVFVDRHDTGVGIKAEREEQADEEESKAFC